MCVAAPVRPTTCPRPCECSPLFFLTLQLDSNTFSVMAASPAEGEDELREGLSSPNHNFKTKLLSSTKIVKPSNLYSIKLS